MSDFERSLARLVRAHAPAVTSHTTGAFDPSLELHAELGFGLIARAELAVALEDAYGIAVDLADLERCRLSAT